jgi:hypothetical protein
MSKNRNRRRRNKSNNFEDFKLPYINKSFKEGKKVIISEKCRINPGVIGKVTGYNYKNGYVFLDIDQDNSYFPGILSEYNIFYIIRNLFKR